MATYGTFPYFLSIPAVSGGIYTNTGTPYNYAIGGLPFLSAASHNNPYARSTAPFRKQQFDSQEEVGEQSLDGWWLKSQQTFHGGCGQLYMDPNASDASFSPSRYWQSKGVNPWTPGQLSLLPTADVLTVASAASITSDGVRAVGLLDNEDLFFVDEDGMYTTDTVPVLGFGYATKEDITLDSSRYFLATDTVLYTRDIADAPLSPWTSIWFTIESGDPVPTDVVLGWVKERLVMATNSGVYEITDFSGPEDYLPDANWRPPQGSWIPKSITESNSAIYVAGVLNGERSVILRFTLDASGAMPTLTSGVVVANLPQGEEIGAIYGYLGRFMAISTSLGPRIAEIDSNGDLTVGPVLFTGSTGNWVARGQYLYANAVLPEWEGSEGGLVRIDLGLQHSELRFAYASDLYVGDAGTGTTGVGLIGNGRLLIAADGGLFVESATEFVDSGWLQSSRVRYFTLEPKIYKLLRVRGSILESDFSVSVVDPDGDEHPVVGYVAGQTPGASDVPIPSLGPLDYLSVRLTLNSDASHLISAVSGGWQLKAIPGQPRQRLITLPLYCFDSEVDRSGMTLGSLGSARERLLALESLERAGDTQVMQDFDGNDLVTVSIEKVEFTQTSPPWSSSAANWGGVIMLTLRTVF